METTSLMEWVLAVLLLVLAIGGVVVVSMSMQGRQRIRELAYRERIALIEKGLVPSPEADPEGFEAMLAPRTMSPKAIRYRTGGVILTALGLAYTILIFFVVPDIRGIALGVGGFLTVLGLASFVNGMLLAGDGMEGSRRNSTPRG